MNEDEALLEAQREIAQLKRRNKKLQRQNESLAARIQAAHVQQRQLGRLQLTEDVGAIWNSYWEMFRKCERQRQAILNIQASPRGAKHWVAEYIIEEQETLDA